MNSIFTFRHRAKLVALMLLPPISYWLYLRAALPPDSLRPLPITLLVVLLLPALPLVTDFRLALGSDRVFLARVKNNPNYRKLSWLSAGFLGLIWCYLLQQQIIPAARESKWLAAGMAVFVMLLGNYQAALSQPAYMALTFDTPFMRRYGDLVARAYRWAARLLFLGGLLGLGAVWWLPVEQGLLAVVGIELLAGLLAFLCFGVWFLQRRWRASQNEV